VTAFRNERPYKNTSNFTEKKTMNTKNILIASLVLATAASQAQILNADASLTAQFNTDAMATTFGNATLIQSAGRGVGYGSNSSWFPNAQGEANAITHYNFGKYNGANIASGDFFQFGVHAYAVNAASPTNNGTAPVSIFVSIFKAAAGAPGAGSINALGAAIIQNAEIKIRNNTSSAAISERIYYTDKLNTLASLSAGEQYIIKFAPSVGGTGSATNFAVLVPRATTTAGTSLSSMSQADKDLFRREWITNANSAVANIYREAPGSNVNPVAYRMYTAAVPEPASMLVLGAGVLALIRKRKNA
jgi:hypothetical protein